MPKVINKKISQLEQLVDYDSSNTENFESLVDLFTLLSFALIIASFLFGQKHIQEYDNIHQTSSSFREIQRGGAPPVGIPENTLILILTIENNKDIVYILKSGKSLQSIYQSGQYKPLWNCLEEEKQLFMDSNDIQIIVNNISNKVNAELFLIIEKWLARYSFKAAINFHRIIDE